MVDGIAKTPWFRTPVVVEYILTVPVVVDGVAKTPQSRLRSAGREFYDTFQFNYITLFSVEFK